jgi:hypothetical protein
LSGAAAETKLMKGPSNICGESEQKSDFDQNKYTKNHFRLKVVEGYCQR